jgi:hypothetical protein
MDPEGAGLVRGGGHDASPVRLATDDHRLALELPVERLLHGDEEGV